MKAIVCAALLVLFGSSIAVAGESAADADTKRKVRNLEKKRIRAMIDGDRLFLNHILADDLTYSHSTGIVQTKSDFIESVAGGDIDYLSIGPAGTDIRIYNDTAVVTGTAAFEVKAGGEHHAVSLRYTCVYVEREGVWQVVAWHSTRIPVAKQGG